jgi:hypothetical protein
MQCSGGLDDLTTRSGGQRSERWVGIEMPFWDKRVGDRVIGQRWREVAGVKVGHFMSLSCYRLIALSQAELASQGADLG